MSDLDSIVSNVTNRISALALSWQGTVLTVEKVNGHRHRQGIDSPYRITVSRSANPERYSSWTFDTKRVDYDVEVVIQAPHTDDPDTLEIYSTWRQRIMDTFWQASLPGVPSVFLTQPRPGNFLDRSKMQSQWDLQEVEITCSITKPK